MMEARIVNYTSCCRLCLTDKHNSLNSIYSGYSDSDGLVEKISLLVGVQINVTDKFSTMLCDKCFSTVTNWELYKKMCLTNQTKLQQWMDNESISNSTIQIKEEPIDCEENNEIIHINNQEEDITIKPEPIELDDQLFLDVPPLLSPHHPEGNDDEIEEEIATENHNEPEGRAEVSVELKDPKTCTVCNKQFSSLSNRNKHEKVMHGLHKTAKYPSHALDAVPKVSDDVEPQDSEGNPEGDNSNKTVPANEKDKEKIEFAAGLCLQSKSVAPKQSELTKIEHSYLEKCRIMISMFKKGVCACHNHNYGSLKKLLGHLRQLYSWFPPYTCYNCLLTFEGRSGKMKHTLRCPKVNFEFLIRLSELRARTDDKIRLYQNFKCIQCNVLFGFYDDYCEHVDNEHVSEEGPHTCLCLQDFDNADVFRQHIHKACYLNYYCDICFLLSPSLEEFRQHCEESHDVDENFSFLPVSPKFNVLNNIEIANMLVHSKEKEVEPEPDVMLEPLKPDDEDGRANFITTGSKGSASCKICNKVYSSYHNMLRHLKVFHNIDEMPKVLKNECTICGNEFSNYHNMLRHRKLHEDDQKTLQCPDCPEKFRLNIELKEHLNTIHSSVRSVRSLYKCEDCGEAFKNPKALEFHQESEHVFKCDDCAKEFHKSSDYEQHRTVHLNITLTRDPKTQNYQSVNKMCQACDKAFQTDAELQSHMLLHDKMPTLDIEEVDSKDFKKYACSDCNKVYQSSRGLWVHNKRFHPGRTSNKDFPKPCDECDRIITTLPAWIMHKQMHERTTMRAYNIHKVVDAKGNDDSDYHTCKRCFKVFASKYNLKTHMKCHGINLNSSRTYTKTGKFHKTFWCDICHQACQGVADLNRHKQEHLNEDLPELENNLEITEVRKPQKRMYQFKNSMEIEERTQVYCKYCKIPFDSVPDLNEHMDNEHEESMDVKPIKIFKGRYCCDLCNKTFTTSSALCSHQGWHKRGNVTRTIKTESKLYKKVLNTFAEPKGNPKFKCISCAEAFDDDTTLQLHILEVHRNINATILTIKCTLCNLEFNSQAEFDGHEKLHYKQKDNKTGVLCRFCNKMFSRSDYLNIHISKKHPQHAVVGSFKCNQCERIFEKQNALTIHLKVHERLNSNGNNSQASGKVFKYSCSICHIGFNIPKDLRNHIIANHPF